MVASVNQQNLTGYGCRQLRLLTDGDFHVVEMFLSGLKNDGIDQPCYLLKSMVRCDLQKIF